MKKFYYQIKIKDPDPCAFSNWIWPPVLSDMVEAENKKEAKLFIDNEYSRKFPQRVLTKNLKDYEFLLHIREINKDDLKTLSLFEIKHCEYCNGGFRVIDKYNNIHESNKGTKFCSEKCANSHYQENRTDKDFDTGYYGVEQPVIYRILNIITGKSYIGKTTQIFTLRWYQHFFQPNSTKFHKAIKKSKLEDWTFSVIESVIIPDGEDKDKFIASRERFYINKFDSIKCGYNTAKV